MDTRLRSNGRPRHPDVLTPAEWDVLAAVREGLSNVAIAEQRGCSLETVRYHLRNVRQKLGLRSRESLRAWPGRPAPLLDAAPEARAWRLREQIPLLAVRDVERALTLYRDVLGMSVLARWPDAPEAPGWVALGGGAARLMLHAGHHLRDDASLRGPGGVTLSLYVDGLDALREALAAAGFAPGEPQRMFYGARECYLIDADGHELALVEFRASDPGYLTAGEAAGETGDQPGVTPEDGDRDG